MGALTTQACASCGYTSFAGICTDLTCQCRTILKCTSITLT